MDKYKLIEEIFREVSGVVFKKILATIERKGEKGEEKKSRGKRGREEIFREKNRKITKKIKGKKLCREF